ncbi:MAG: dephospho-CoA kinase [Candidatus Cloacimonetes bacterium]|jgi:dephospho-CoA kinase|nr:dephospho-CoA kinase [Candidatus Cloacimonadota bacterium]MDD4156569.1 dephospho-CoA kinase [Candidatus Cloacimonadota bacterium]
MKQKKSNRPLLLSITGDIASGKSSVTKYFSDKGYLVYSADDINAQILKRANTINDLVNLFGKAILKTSNSIMEIDKQKFREIIFSNQYQNVKKLNDYLHPKILFEMQQYINNCNDKILFFEVPLLFECNLQYCFDINIIVTAEYKIKIERIIKRDNCSEDIAKNILKNQINQEIKQSLSDIIIDNNFDLDSLIKQLNVLEMCIHFFKKKNRVTLLSDISC